MLLAELASNALTAYDPEKLGTVEKLLSLRETLLSKISDGSAKTDQQLYCVFNLLEEWRDIHNAGVPIPKGIATIKKLVSWVEHNEKADTLTLFRQVEWAQLVELRGPVEAILHCQCRKCGCEFVRMGTSGFTDEIGWICSDCGSVIFRSVYETKTAELCTCGGKTCQGCPACDSQEFEVTRTSSPYGYFANHTWRRIV